VTLHRRSRKARRPRADNTLYLAIPAKATGFRGRRMGPLGMRGTVFFVYPHAVVKDVFVGEKDAP